MNAWPTPSPVLAIAPIPELIISAVMNREGNSSLSTQYWLFYLEWLRSFQCLLPRLPFTLVAHVGDTNVELMDKTSPIDSAYAHSPEKDALKDGSPQGNAKYSTSDHELAVENG